MTAWDDMNHEVQPLTLDGETADRLLAGGIALADAPPGYGPVLRLLDAASAEARPDELAREREAVAAFAAAVRSRRLATAPRFRFTRARVSVVVAVVVLAVTTGLAAAGTLPGPAQKLVSRLLDKVGISVPSSTDGEPARPDSFGLASAPAPTGRGHSVQTVVVAGAVAVIRSDRGVASSGSESRGARQAGRVGLTGTSPRGGRQAGSDASASSQPPEAAVTAKPTEVEQEPSEPKPMSKGPTQTRKGDSTGAAHPGHGRTAKRPAAPATPSNRRGGATVTKPSHPGKGASAKAGGGPGSGTPQNGKAPGGGNGSGGPPNPPPNHGPPNTPPNPGPPNPPPSPGPPNPPPNPGPPSPPCPTSPRPQHA